MSQHGPFGFDPEDFDRVVAEASEGLREAFDLVSRFIDKSGDRSGWASFMDDIGGGAARPKPRSPKEPAPETVEKAEGVWVIYTHDDAGAARVEQAFPTELDALRAHKDNVDPTRKVRFLPYGVTISVLDALDD
ncbi:hypothetical protein [Antrihabitans stalactiti]|uniref:Transmembrane protein n=1 Tax=Antrihabitans stalactiti TaxID=2584121 RepID=A0A848KKY1_9NOCA|nr:hypothetical protein [Antrihabitans stalactiti]